MQEYNRSAELYHHGILGQRWGIRRYQNKDGTLTAKGRQRQARQARQDSKKQKKEDVKNRSTMSTAELQQKIQQLKLEKQLKDLTESDLNPGKKAAKDVLAQSGKKVATTAVTGATIYAIKAAVSKEFNVKELGNAVFYGGAKKK